MPRRSADDAPGRQPSADPAQSAGERGPSRRPIVPRDTAASSDRPIPHRPHRPDRPDHAPVSPRGTDPSRHSTVFSASEAYVRAAEEGLLALLPGAEVERIGPDVACLVAQIDVSAVAELCRSHPIPFVRHLMRQDERLPYTGAPVDVGRVLDAVATVSAELSGAASLALQIWASGVSPEGYRLEELWHRIANRLAERGWRRRGPTGSGSFRSA